MTSTLIGNAAQSAASSSMKAWRVHEFGPPEAMIFETALRPEPGPDEVLVKVHAVGVGPWDGWIRAGKSALPQPLPLTLGSDLSGELGYGISELAAGDQVFGVTNPQFVGAYAEYAVASAGMLAKNQARLAMSKRLPFPSSLLRLGRVCSTKPTSKLARRSSSMELPGTSEPTQFSSLVALACAASRRRGPKTSSTCGPSVQTKWWTITRNASKMRSGMPTRCSISSAARRSYVRFRSFARVAN